MKNSNQCGRPSRSGLSAKILGRAEYDKKMRIVKAVRAGRVPILRPHWTGLPPVKETGRAAYVRQWRALRATKESAHVPLKQRPPMMQRIPVERQGVPGRILIKKPTTGPCQNQNAANRIVERLTGIKAKGISLE